MKNILVIISVLTFFGCKAQITPIYNEEYISSSINSYYKDVDNDFDSFVGVWKWEQGNNILELTFNKIVNYTDGDGDYFDFLVGEYKYSVNGVVIINTYPELEVYDTNGMLIIVEQDPYDNNIQSYDIRTDAGYIPPCNECDPNTRFVIASLSDPTRQNLTGVISMGIYIENGITKMKANIGVTLNTNDAGSFTSSNELTIPDGILTFTKVE